MIIPDMGLEQYLKLLYNTMYHTRSELIELPRDANHPGDKVAFVYLSAFAYFPHF